MPQRIKQWLNAPKIIELIKTSPFLRHNAVFLAGSLGVAALNYLFYPILGRIMSPADFGEVQTLTSLFTQAAIFLTILTYVTIHVTVNTPDEQERNQTLLGLEKVAMIAGYSLLTVALLSVKRTATTETTVTKITTRTKATMVTVVATMPSLRTLPQTKAVMTTYFLS